jgi:monooxygenase
LSLEHVDVLIVGAGLSGIGAACHLQTDSPQKSYAILEARAAIGGTWDLFRYPGIRSDSDMYTLGYSFRPWEHAKSIADGSSILDYVRDTASDHDVERHIRFGHHVERAEWSSPDARWTVHATREDTGEPVALTCDFLFTCTGYYRYDQGHTPDFPGVESFAGEIVHPQHWDERIDHAGKRVVVIGSGATAVTLVPELAETAQHVTMLQRSPTYIVSLPDEDPLAKRVRRLLPAKAAYSVVRWKNVLLGILTFQLSRRRPAFVKRLIQRAIERQLPTGYDIATHFNPEYGPWDQRMCLVPNGDLFGALSSERASIVTDHIDTFTPTGLRLRSGRTLDADLIVTATGLSLLALGGMQIAVDGCEIDVAETMVYRGMMLSGLPNFAMAFGYANASWTLKCDLTCAYVCRLLNHMDQHGYAYCTPVNDDPSLIAEPFFDFTSGYVQRSIHLLPKQGSRAPWRVHQNYVLDRRSMRGNELEDGELRFTRRSTAAVSPNEPLATASA